MRRFSALPGAAGLSFGIGCIALLFWYAAAQAQEFLRSEYPPPATVQESKTPMDEAFKKAPERVPLLTGIKEKLKDEAPFIRDLRVDVNPRTFYFHRVPFTGNINEAWAIGGSTAFRSGYLFDHLGVGAALYTSQPLHAPDDRDGTLLLRPGQEGYTVLGQSYGDIRLVDDVHLYLFRKEYDTPYMNKNDTRMTPNTFEGYTLVGRHTGEGGVPAIRYGAGYITKIKPRNSSSFIPMSEAAGAQQGADRGVVVGGGNFSTDKYSIGAIDYYYQDIINIFYTEGKVTLPVTKDWGLLFAAQFSEQRSTGDNLLTGSDFSSHQVGVKTEASFGGAVMTLAYTNTAKGSDMRSPWSGYPGYTSVQVQDFNRAGEEALMVKLSSHLSRFGLEGVTLYGLWVHGWGAVDPVSRTPVFNQDEYDIDLQWRPKIDFLKGLWFRTRYAYVDQRGANNSSINDFRIIVNYDLPLL